jgi:glutathione S-transferase/RNA polymerase-associated protein
MTLPSIFTAPIQGASGEDAMVILFEHPLSPYVQKVKIALREKNVAFEVRQPDILTGGSAEFMATNPRAEVPSLVDGENVIFDSTIICEYVDEKWPEPALLPRDPGARARVRMIEDMCDTSYDPPCWGMMEIAAFRRAEGEAFERLASAAQEDVIGVNEWLTRMLGDRPWFNGDDFGWGDMAVAPFVKFASVVNMAPGPGPLADWYARVSGRPTVAETFAEADASLGGVDQLPAVMESGFFKREYRDHRLDWMIRSGGIDVVLDGLRRDNIRFTYPVR